MKPPMMTEIRPLGQYMQVKLFTIRSLMKPVLTNKSVARFFSIPLIVFSSLSVSTVSAQDIYKCVKANGDVEYTHETGNGCKKQVIKEPVKKAEVPVDESKPLTEKERYKKLSPQDQTPVSSDERPY